MFEHTDPSGFYAALGVTPDADLSVIKQAYRERAKALHPDAHSQTSDLVRFRKVNEAWEVLRNPSKRAQYDQGLAAINEHEPPSLFPCCRCGQVTAQPRYVVFRQVKSFLVWAKVARQEGIFCRSCADRVAAAASTKTWLLGWWSLPGLILTPLVLVGNLMGGKKPDDANARLLLCQARAFLNRGDVELAQGVAHQAARFARRAGFANSAATLSQMARGTGNPRRLKDRWRPWRGVSFYAQLLPLVTLPLAVFAVIATLVWKPAPLEQAVASGDIAADPPVVGELRHVAVDALKLRVQPKDGAPVLTLLDRFAMVTVVAPTDNKDWVEVRAANGYDGFVPIFSLYGGSSELARREWCGQHLGGKLQAGEVLMRRATGDHEVLVHNGLRHDAVVKFKTTAGYTVATVFIPATYRLGVTGLPDGTYMIEFATGSQFSRSCSLFVDGGEQYRLSIALTLRHLSALKGPNLLSKVPEISLTDLPNDTGKPQSIAAERFAADD